MNYKGGGSTQLYSVVLFNTKEIYQTTISSINSKQQIMVEEYQPCLLMFYFIVTSDNLVTNRLPLKE